MTDGVRTILHVDMDAFFVSVELLRRPELRGRPVVVGGKGQRGVVAAASYEARSYGVFSAMPSTQAVRLCPEAVFLPGDHATYSQVSTRVMAIFESFTPLVEPLSLDEAFLDVSGSRRLHGDGPAIASAIRARVLDEEGLECSVGVASSKFVAKLASGAAKPTASPAGPVPGKGVVVVEPGGETDFLHPLAVSALWGVGPATRDRLGRLGITTVAHLASTPLPSLVASLGAATGAHLHRLANAIDERLVTPNAQPKSVSHEETYSSDLHDPTRINTELVRQADAVAARLRRLGLVGRTVTVKVRFPDFHTVTRSTTLAVPVDAGPVIARAAKDLISSVDLSAGVRLLGVGVTGLDEPGPHQLTFDDVDSQANDAEWETATDAVDRIRGRYGDTAIGPAAAISSDGLRLVRRGAQQWGPGDPWT
jgi:DNA polymerase IV